MANPVGFRESTHVIGKPASMSDEECSQLPVYADGQQFISCWKLTPEELQEVARTGVVYISIMSGLQLPPCWVAGANPFRES